MDTYLRHYRPRLCDGKLASLYRRKVEQLQEALADPVVRAEALGILRGLIDGVVTHPQEKGFSVELVGEIANTVALALGPQTTKAALDKATIPDAYRRSVKVVAGATFLFYARFSASGLSKSPSRSSR